MTAHNQAFLEIRLSRRLLLGLIIIGFIFLLLGLDVLLWGNIFEPASVTNPALKFLFGIFSVAIGLIIVVSQIIYFIKPPIMLTVTPKEIIFGTGFRYQPYSLPLSLLKSVKAFPGSVILELADDSRYPASLAASIGISYHQYHLNLIRPYIDTAPSEIKERIETLIENNGRAE